MKCSVPVCGPEGRSEFPVFFERPKGFHAATPIVRQAACCMAGIILGYQRGQRDKIRRQMLVFSRYNIMKGLVSVFKTPKP